MKNKFFLKLGSLTLAISSVLATQGILYNGLAYENVVNLPWQQLNIVQILMNNSKNTNIYALIDQYDNNFSINFSGSSGHELPDPGAGNIYFAVFKDGLTGKVLATKALDVYAQRYSISYEAPHNVDVVDVSIYSQSSSYAVFYPNGTPIGSLRLFNASNSIYYNRTTDITYYDDQGAAQADKASAMLTRLTPNLFSLSLQKNIDGATLASNPIGVIEPVSGGNKMTESDKLVRMSLFQCLYPYDATTVGQVISNDDNGKNKAYYNFNLPQDVTEFYFKIYKNGEVKSDNLVAQYHIHLNRS